MHKTSLHYLFYQIGYPVGPKERRACFGQSALSKCARPEGGPRILKVLIARDFSALFIIGLGILSGPGRGVRAFGNQHFQNARDLKEVSRILKVLIAQDFSALFILSNWI